MSCYDYIKSESNYIWIIRNHSKECAVVDPGNGDAVLNYLTTHNLTLTAILITHHHNDHTAGIPQLAGFTDIFTALIMKKLMVSHTH